MTKNIFLFCYFFAISAFGQTPALEWAAQMGGISSDKSEDIVTDSLGNVYVTGYFRDTVDFDPSSNENLLVSSGGPNIFISKFTPNGQLAWAVSIGDSLWQTSNALHVDNAGNVYVTGRFSGTVDFDPGPATNNLSGATDIYILKLDTNGSFIWAKTMGGSGSHEGKSIIVDDLGNVYTTGTFGGTVDFDPGSGTYFLETDNFFEDVFISKINNNGDFVWAKSLGWFWFDSGESIALDSDNNIYTTGNFSADDDEQKLFISKHDTDGNDVWIQIIGNGSSYTGGTSIAVDKDDNVYSTGFFSGVVDFAPGLDTAFLSSIEGVFILKLNTNGEYIWARALDTGEHDQESILALDKSSNVYITGHFDEPVDLNPGPDTTYLSGDGDIYILKLDTDGEFNWVTSLTGIGNDYASSIALDNWDNIYMTGAFWNTLDLDFELSIDELTSNGFSDAYVTKMHQTCNAIPFINISDGNYLICSQDTVELSVEIPNWANNVLYNWDTGESMDSILVSPNTTSSYSVSVYYTVDSIVCNGFASVDILVFESDTAFLESTSCDSSAVGSTAFIFIDQNSCDSTVFLTTTLIPVPDIPILPSDFIIQEGAPPFEITVPEVPNAITYFWEVPQGVQIVSGVNTNSITVDWNEVGMGGLVCVSAINECGSSPSDCLEITVDIIDDLNEVHPRGYSIFPNPSKSVFNVVFQDDQIYEISLFDVLGRVVLAPDYFVGQAQLMVDDLANGNYWMKINTGNIVFWEPVQVKR